VQARLRREATSPKVWLIPRRSSIRSKVAGFPRLGTPTSKWTNPERGGLLSRLRGDSDSGIDSTETTNRVTSLVRKATLGRLTLPCEVNGTERALLVVAGPPEYLNRKGIRTRAEVARRADRDRWRFAVVTIHGAERDGRGARSVGWRDKRPAGEKSFSRSPSKHRRTSGRSPVKARIGSRS